MEQEEKWIKKLPKFGDHIRVDRGMYFHHGIYVSDEEIIHFTGTDEDDLLGINNEVIATDLQFFLKGGNLEVREYTKDDQLDLYPRKQIVRRAKSCIGKKGYNLIFNNCEHFANVCALGQHHSQQVTDVFQPKMPEAVENYQFGDITRCLRQEMKVLLDKNMDGKIDLLDAIEEQKEKIAQIENEYRAEIESIKNLHNELWSSIQKEVEKIL